MSKYIDADKLIKSVNNYREGAKAALNPIDGDADYYKGKIDACENIQELIASLQQEQPEVDLEKEIKRFLSNATKMNKGEWRGKYPISDIGFRAVARHFYELGLNARKEDAK